MSMLDDIINGKTPEEINNEYNPTLKEESKNEETITSRKIVSISDMVAAGVVKEGEELGFEKSAKEKALDIISDPNNLIPSINRRLETLREDEEKEYEERMKKEIDEEDKILGLEDYDDESAEKEVKESSSMDEYVTERVVTNDEDDYDVDLLDIMNYGGEDMIFDDEDIKATVDNSDNNTTVEVIDSANEEEVVNIKPVEQIVAHANEFRTDKVEFKHHTYEEMNSVVITDAELREVLDDENDEDTSNDEDKELIERLTKELKEKIGKNTTVSTNGVASKGVSLSTAINAGKNNHRVVDSVLYYSGMVISMTSFSGPEIAKWVSLFYATVDESTPRRTKDSSRDEMFQMMYTHVASPKPSTMEMWLKSIDYRDYQNLLFSVYNACYRDSNYLTRECTECKHTFLSDTVPISSMIKFKNDKVKEEYKKIFESGNNKFVKKTKIIDLNNLYAMGIRNPTIYDIEYNNITDAKFRAKYSVTLDRIMFIDKLYLIDPNTSQYREILFKTHADNKEKTERNRIVGCTAIFNNLTSDEYYLMDHTIEKYVDMTYDAVSYQYPETTCPKCGSIIKSSEIDAMNAVFMRHRLVHGTTI